MVLLIKILKSWWDAPMMLESVCVRNRSRTLGNDFRGPSDTRLELRKHSLSEIVQSLTAIPKVSRQYKSIQLQGVIVKSPNLYSNNMPPRTPSAVSNSIWNLSSLLQSLPSSTSTAALTKCSACLFSTTAHLEQERIRRHKRKSQDPYREAQARQRKNANLARQKVLQAQRQAALGDPVRSTPTPFVQSLRTPRSSTTSASSPAANEEHLNFYLTPDSMTKQLAHSKWLTEPIPESELAGGTTADSVEADTRHKRAHEAQHENAERALQSITSLETGSSKDRTRVNIQRCIAEFGRHNTELFLPPKPAPLLPTGASPPPPMSESEAAAAAELAALPKRVGADTGSSEVQVAILTAKINVLADNLGKKDKHNKRNLRLLVHRRQKLLSYLRRKERGGPRWAHLVEKLGINDAMWKGEISL